MQDAPQSEDHVIVLLAAPGKAELADEVLAQVIGTVGMFVPELRWLEEKGRTAAEVAFSPPPPSHFQPRSLESRLCGRLMGLAIDVAVLPLGGRRKRLVMCDVPETAPGADVLAATMRAAGGSALFGVAAPPAGLPSPEQVLAAASDAQHAAALFASASLRVAFHATDAVARHADARIDHHDLRALLYLQGYRHDQFASST